MNDNYRPEELAHLERLASRDDVQTITVAGNRGMGKTFLAHRFAENMAHHGRNVAFLTVSSASPAVDLLRLDRLLDGIGGADGPHTTHPAPARPIVILDDLAQPSSSALIERARREGALTVRLLEYLD